MKILCCQERSRRLGRFAKEKKKKPGEFHCIIRRKIEQRPG